MGGMSFTVWGPLDSNGYVVGVWGVAKLLFESTHKNNVEEASFRNPYQYRQYGPGHQRPKRRKHDFFQD
jgi:hypothetical protein